MIEYDKFEPFMIAYFGTSAGIADVTDEWHQYPLNLNIHSW